MRAALGLLLAVLALCGGCAQAPSGKVVTLRMVLWGTAKDEASLNDSLKRFYKSHPNIRVKLEITPHARVFDKLLISYAGGRAPDVSRVSSLWFYPLAAKGVLEDLDPFIRADSSFDLSDFYGVALDGWGKYQGRVYALPTDLDLYGIYYNKKMFAKAGIPFPDASWDWNTYLQVARKLTRDTDGDGKIDQWGSTVDGFWQAYVWQNGGDILNASHTKCLLDQPAAYEALQWMTDLRQKWHVAPSPADTADVGQLGLWVMGRIGMFHSGSWAAAMMFKDRVTSFEWDVAPLPKGKVRASFLGGSAFSMVAGSRHKKEAWELVKFMTSPYIQARWAVENQIIPSRRSIAESGAFLNQPGPPAHRKVFVDAVSYGRTLPNTYSMREMNDIITNFISLAILGKTDAKSACMTVTPMVNDLLMYDRKRHLSDPERTADANMLKP